MASSSRFSQLEISDISSIYSSMSAPPYTESDSDTLPSIDHAERSNGMLTLDNADTRADAVLQDDGLLDITVHSTTQQPVFSQPAQLPTHYGSRPEPSRYAASLRRKPVSAPPRLNIVMQVVGSRGDVQPFIHLGQELQKYGHRVRLATHGCFNTFVRSHGLEFFGIGGDPNELMSYMVRNPGLLPTMEAIKHGDVAKQRAQLHVMLNGCWQSCFASRDDERPFVADVIIANPPAFAHVHCAEKLGVPLHVVFTMPWTPTKSFAHPLTRTHASGIDVGAANIASYHLMEMMLAQGTRSPVNKLRRRTLDLEPIDITYAAGLLDRLRVPMTYLWPPCLVPKPADWDDHITIAGACRPEASAHYDAAPALVKFLEAGPVPVYIGFGSIVDSDSAALTEIILKALELTGVRAIVSRGWSQLGSTSSIPGSVCLIDDVPHEWLFDRVSCVVHHGGAGTTFAGLRAGLPTVIIPFFGDQYFWGDMVYRAGAGPPPLARKSLSAETLAEAITAAMSGSCRTAAADIASKLEVEDGAANFVTAFHAQLPTSAMRCSLDPSRAAVWKLSSRSQKGLRLSTFSASVLLKEGCISIKKLERLRVTEYNAVQGPREPFSGSTIAVTKDIYGVFKGFGEIGASIDRSARRLDQVGRQRPVAPVAAAGDDDPSQDESANFTRSGRSARKGSARVLGSIVRMPMTFTLALARGAHNAPRMLNDPLVREPDAITDFKSGMIAGCKGLALGTYDGVTGLFMQPYVGARDGGVVGGLLGVGKGLVGAPMKLFEAMAAPVGYPLKGIDMEISQAVAKRHRDPVDTARIAQGEWEYHESSDADREKVLSAWKALSL